jgi:hypothetical protein
MATTTNYGWTTPDDTALVKDGAAAIRTLGTSVDTTTKNLNPSTTLGDIEYRSSTANTNTRLGIGTSGQVLSVSGGVPAWVTSSSGGMTLLSTTNLSGASTTISSIDQTYINLFVVVRNAYASNSGELSIQPNSVASSGFFAGVRGNSVDQRQSIAFPDMTTTSNVLNSIFIEINQYANTTFGKPTLFYGTSMNNNDSTLSYGGNINTASAITAIKFQPQTGTFSGGSVLIYGVK